jgi:hypothetical protein
MQNYIKRCWQCIDDIKTAWIPACAGMTATGLSPLCFAGAINYMEKNN